MTEEQQLKLVKQDGLSIIDIKKPSENVQLEAVKQNGNALKYITEPSENVQLEAVRQNVYSIQYIKKPSGNIQIEAFKQNNEAINYIDKTLLITLFNDWINSEKVYIIMKRAVKVGSKSVVHAVFVDRDLAEQTRKDLAIAAQDLMFYYTETHGITRGKNHV